MRDRLAVAELGATFLGGLVGDVSIPKRTGTATAYWFGADDSDSVTESTGTIGTVTMTPKTVGALSKFSHLMNLQSTPDIEQLIRADFVALLADAIDTAAINGSGSSNQPTGILNTSGIGSVAGGTNGLAPTLDHLLDLKKEVAVDNADVASCGYLTNACLIGSSATATKHWQKTPLSAVCHLSLSSGAKPAGCQQTLGVTTTGVRLKPTSRI